MSPTPVAAPGRGRPSSVSASLSADATSTLGRWRGQTATPGSRRLSLARARVLRRHRRRRRRHHQMALRRHSATTSGWSWQQQSSTPSTVCRRTRTVVSSLEPLPLEGAASAGTRSLRLRKSSWLRGKSHSRGLSSQTVGATLLDQSILQWWPRGSSADTCRFLYLRSSGRHQQVSGRGRERGGSVPPTAERAGASPSWRRCNCSTEPGAAKVVQLAEARRRSCGRPFELASLVQADTAERWLQAG